MKKASKLLKGQLAEAKEANENMIKKKEHSSFIKKMIKKKEHSSFIKKFTHDELIEKEIELSKVCTEKAKAENKIFHLKEDIKQAGNKANALLKEIEVGGVTKWDECDVEITVSEMKKRFYYEGELVDEKDADESDLQLEINEDEN
jgi:hypothetical protein